VRPACDRWTDPKAPQAHDHTTERYADYAPRATEAEWITAAFAVATGTRSEADHVAS
jgi:hypothetical protein